MRTRFVIIFSLIAFSLSVSVRPTMVSAEDLIVKKNSTDQTHYSTIQAAINFASDQIKLDSQKSYTIRVEPGTYNERITLVSSVPLRGREAGRTIINAGGTGTAITASGVTGLNVQNFTITNATTGIAVSNNANITIENNIFRVGVSNTALSIQGATAARTVNNTFYQNSVAIVRDTDTEITNNIFSGNDTNISQGALTAQANVTYNLFHPAPTASGEIIGSNSIPSNDYPNPDPLFVNPAQTDQADFHLKVNSPAIDTGSNSITDRVKPSRSDIGAYGGTNADTIPTPVSNLTTTVTGSTITVNWSPNNAYTVTGYKLYYGTTSSYGGTGATEGASPISLTTTSGTLSSLPTTTITLSAPVMNPPQPANERLILSWAAVPNATRYTVYYGIVSYDEHSIDVGSVTTHTLSGLTNGITYQVAVRAIAQQTYYIAVTAHDEGSSQKPGEEHESAYTTSTVNVGDAQESPLSNVESDFPEPIVPYPHLPKEGCFIASAAYGSPSMPQVKILHQFRDRYLVTNRAGLAVARLYYTFSPAAADFVNQHPWLKPLVRSALAPMVSAAWFLTSTNTAMKLMLLVFVCFLGAAIIDRVRSREARS